MLKRDFVCMYVFVDMQVLLKRGDGWTMKQMGAMIASTLEKVRMNDYLW